MMSSPNCQPLLRARMPELDSLRGVAVLMVVLFHGFYFSTGAGHFQGPVRWFLLATAMGWSGVNLFFVLSGFLITGILMESRNSPDYYRSFYWRRALRILPAYYAILAVVLIASRTGIVQRQISWPFLALSVIYLSNVTMLFGVPTQYAVLWSLAVEEHFYLLWPTVLRNFSRRWLPLICLLIIFACPALRAFCYWQHYEYGAGYTWLVADGLAWGSLIAVLIRGKFSSRESMLKFGLACSLGSLAVALVLIPFGIAQSGAFAGGVVRVSLINCFCAGVVALSVLGGSGSRRGLFHRPLLRFLGEISYGFYLVHMLAFDIVDQALGKWRLEISKTTGSLALICARFAMAITIAVAVAYFSRKYYEEPFLRLKHKFAASRVSPAIEISQESDLAAKTAS